LTDLRLYTNSLTGTIPSLPTGLTIIDLHVNSLSGSIPSLPTGLTYLDLSNNSLSGSIPSLPAGLTYLLLPKNKLSGTLPSFASLTSLTLPYHLDLGYNALTSAAPGEDALVLSKQSNWKDTQTVAPAPVVVTPSPVVTILPVTIVSANFSCATTGDIGEVCNYSGREVTDLNVQKTSSVSNGVVLATVVNQGWVSNFHITATGKLSGGVVTGYIVNEGVMQDFKFVGMSILGGTLGGVITNNSRVGGYFQDVTLLPNTKITGGILSGIITGDKNAPALLENVRVKGRSKLSGVKLGKNVKLEKGVLLEDK